MLVLIGCLFHAVNTRGQSLGMWNNADHLVFGQPVALTEFMRLTTSGNLGIGTTTPGTDILGTTDNLGHIVHLRSTLGESKLILQSGQPEISWVQTTGAANQRWIRAVLSGGVLVFNSENDAYVVQNTPLSMALATGRVGIGTPSPSSKLQVHQATGQSDIFITTDDDLGTGNTTSLFFQSDNDGIPNPAGLGQFNDGALRFTGQGNLVVPDMVITDAGQVGIGILSPGALLDVAGDVKIGNSVLGCAAANAGSVRYNAGVLELCDGASWVPLATSGGSWNTAGNAGTVDGTDFLGTSDNVPFNIRVFNQPSGRIDHVNNNTFFGYRTGLSVTTGLDNTATGQQALESNTTGSENAAAGSGALFSNTIGVNNTAHGMQALYSNIDGFENTAAGSYTLFANTSGVQNTGLGAQSLNANQSGSNNTAAGTYALYSNTTANRNTALGDYSLYLQSYANAGTPWNSSNVAIGYEALYSNQPISTLTGNINTAVGSYSGRSNTTGFYNTFVGGYAGYSNTGSNLNTFVGYRAGFAHNGGGNDANSFFGYVAGQSNTTGIYNTFIGSQSGASNTLGSRNAYVGEGAGYSGLTNSNNTFIGTEVGFFATAGDNNTLLGYSAGGTEANLGNYNTYLGYGAQGSAGLANATAIGKNASVTSGNSMVLGGTGVDGVNVGIGITAPVAKLHVMDAADPVQIMVENSGGNFKTGYGIKTALNEWFIGQEVTSASGFRITDIDAAAVRLQIDQTGNVGIGATSPLALLHVLGAASIPAIPDATPSAGVLRLGTPNGALDIGQDAVAPMALWMQAGNAGSTSALVLQPSGGSVGIGTTDPTMQLHMTGDLAFGMTTYGTANGEIITSATIGFPSSVSVIEFNNGIFPFTVAGLPTPLALPATSDGKILILISTGAGNMTVAEESASELALTNRISHAGNGNFTTIGPGSVILIYSPGSSGGRWLILSTTQ